MGSGELSLPIYLWFNLSSPHRDLFVIIPYCWTTQETLFAFHVAMLSCNYGNLALDS